jgi:hypothetical protein
MLHKDLLQLGQFVFGFFLSRTKVTLSGWDLSVFPPEVVLLETLKLSSTEMLHCFTVHSWVNQGQFQLAILLGGTLTSSPFRKGMLKVLEFKLEKDTSSNPFHFRFQLQNITQLIPKEQQKTSSSSSSSKWGKQGWGWNFSCDVRHIACDNYGAVWCALEGTGGDIWLGRLLGGIKGLLRRTRGGCEAETKKRREGEENLVEVELQRWISSSFSLVCGLGLGEGVLFIATDDRNSIDSVFNSSFTSSSSSCLEANEIHFLTSSSSSGQGFAPLPRSSRILLEELSKSNATIRNAYVIGNVLYLMTTRGLWSCKARLID